VVDELHDLRHLVGRHVLARPGDDVLGLGAGLGLGAQHDHGLDRLAAAFILAPMMQASCTSGYLKSSDSTAPARAGAIPICRLTVIERSQ
jgi:hypothetical protein